MNLNRSHSINMTTTVSRASAECSFSAEQRTGFFTYPLTLYGTAGLEQIFNLAIFYKWHNKQPFMLLHVSLAVASLTVCLDVFAIEFLRFGSPWNRTKVVFGKLVDAVFNIGNRLTFVNLLFISLDRWLSVEFAIQYRIKVSRTKILVAVAMVWVIGCLLIVPGFVVFWDGVVVGCNVYWNVVMKVG